jgi:transcriptional regulator with XRE-family HTH domain
MTNVASGYNFDPVLVFDFGNTRPPDFVRRAFTLSHATQERFAALMGIHRVTLARYLSGAVKPTHVAACAAGFAAMCCGVGIRIPRPAQILQTSRRAGDKS